MLGTLLFLPVLLFVPCAHPRSSRARAGPEGQGREVVMQFSPSAMPKGETGVTRLMQSYPEADGRGILVAILDTGCDLAAAGLLQTSDGRPKYVDFLDCTGGGDIDTKTVAARLPDGSVTGLSGRTLRLGSWAESAAEMRLGAVRLFSLLPRSVLGRVKRERKASFEATQHAAVTAVQREMDALEAGAVTGAAKAAAKKDLELRLKQLGAMMEAYSDAGPLLDVLLYREGAPAAGDTSAAVWRAVVDTSATGDLAAHTPMAPFRIGRQVGDLGWGTELSFCVQVYQDGDLLCIVTDAGSHGTHVAGIVAAHFDTEPSRSGVAPGAQILACKIGDGRLGSAETGTGLVRAIIAAKAAGCHLINLSYGEPYWQCDRGRVAQTFDDAVRKWGMTVFTSAGNDGPALSTLGAPGCLSSAITVGAFVSSQMMSDQYSMLPETVPDTSYSFTSRGPTPDGFFPTLCAPGGAIAPVPRHTLQGKAQYHGTSMASPNACGVAACVLSALHAQGVKPTPAELRRALENSAERPAEHEPFSQGAGLINAPAAVAYALEHHGKPAQRLAFRVTVPSRQHARGIYLRDAAELDGPLTMGVEVVPLFDLPLSSRSAEELSELLSTDLELKLTSSAGWLTAPPSMVLLSAKERGGQTFSVQLDPSSLPSGAHFASITATDATDPSRGPLFSLPVTVVVPAPPPLAFRLDLPPGKPTRRFLSAPEAAEFAHVRIKTGAMPRGPHVVTLHAVPSARGDAPNTLVQTKRMLVLREDSEETVVVPVRGSSTLELCLQLAWLSNPTPAAADVTVEWHSYGVRGRPTTSATALRLGAADSYARLEVSAPLRPERLKPKAELDAVERAIRPSSAAVSAGSAELDVLPPPDAERRADANSPGTQIHAMELTYKFEVSAEPKETRQVIPRVQSAHMQLYDSPLDSQLWVLQGANGCVLGHGGAMHDSPAIKLKKGAYTVRLLLRHPDASLLAKLKELPLLLRMPLDKPLGCSVYSGRGAATVGGHGGAKPMEEVWLKRGGQRQLYVTRPTDALPSWLAAGDALVGAVQLDDAQPAATRLPLVYEVPPHPVKPPAGDENNGAKPAPADATAKGAEAAGAGAGGEAAETQPGDKEAAAEEEDGKALKKALLATKLERLAALRTGGASIARYEALATPLLGEEPAHLPLLTECLAFWRAVAPPADVAPVTSDAAPAGTDAVTAPGGEAAEAIAAWRARVVGNAAGLIQAAVDSAALAQYYGVAHDEADAADGQAEAKELSKEMAEQRKAIRSALLARAATLAPPGGAAVAARVNGTAAATDTAGGAVAGAPPFAAAVREMKQWIDGSDALSTDEEKDTHALTLATFEVTQGRPGAALAGLRARLAVQPTGSKPLSRELVALCRELKLEHWARAIEDELYERFPVAKVLL